MAVRYIWAETRAKALKQAGLGCDTLTRKVDGGYAIFDTADDLKTWLNQK